MDNTWHEVDNYLDSLFGIDPALQAALAAAEKAGLPNIQVSPQQGLLLQVLATAIRARHILEIGTLGGFSTIYLARALPADGRLITLELDAKHAEVAKANFAAAGVSELIELRQGPALESLPAIHKELAGQFDFIFIDADKANLDAYFGWALKLARPGGLILTDNVIRGGQILRKDANESAKGARQFLESVAKRRGVTTSVIQTVGSKDHDGFALSIVGG